MAIAIVFILEIHLGCSVPERPRTRFPIPAVQIRYQVSASDQPLTEETARALNAALQTGVDAAHQRANKDVALDLFAKALAIHWNSAIPDESECHAELQYQSMEFCNDLAWRAGRLQAGPDSVRINVATGAFGALLEGRQDPSLTSGEYFPLGPFWIPASFLEDLKDSPSKIPPVQPATVAGGEHAPAPTSSSDDCTNADLGECVKLAETMESDKTLADSSRALRIFLKACEQRVPAGCGGAARLYHSGWGTNPDLQKARTLFERSCLDGYARGCRGIAKMYRGGDGVPKDASKAAEWYERGCHGEDWPSCTGLGHLLTTDSDVPRDEARGRELFDRACSHDEPQACVNLGIIYAEGMNVPPTPSKAAILFEKGCDGGMASACFDAAMNHYRANPRDRALISDLLRRACRLGNQDGCNTSVPGVDAQEAARTPPKRKATRNLKDEKALRDRLLAP